MENSNELRPTVVVVFGGGGDLTWRKLTPAMLNLYLDKNFPERFGLTATDRLEMSDQALRTRLHEGVRQFSRRGPAADQDWDVFAALKLFVDNWRWHDVPFYLRTGKRLAKRVSEVSVRFRAVPHQAFPRRKVLWTGSVLVGGVFNRFLSGMCKRLRKILFVISAKVWGSYS